MAVVLSFALLVFGIARLRIQRIKRANIILEKKVQERTAQLKAAQTKIVEFEKQALETQMAGGFAHEIRNSLAGAKLLLAQILGNGEENQSFTEEIGDSLLVLFEQLADQIDRDVLSNSGHLIRSINESLKKTERVMDATNEAIEKSLGTTNMILEYSKIHHSGRGADLINVDKLLESVVEEYRVKADEIDVTIKTYLDSDAELTRTDMHIRSIARNLLRNSLDSLQEKSPDLGPQETELIVRSSQDDGVLTIMVEDTGVGIPTEVGARILEPFFSTKPNTGKGLGLNMVMKYVSLYDGNISFESEPGAWTRFQLQFPLDSEDDLQT